MASSREHYSLGLEVAGEPNVMNDFISALSSTGGFDRFTEIIGHQTQLGSDDLVLKLREQNDKPKSEFYKKPSAIILAIDLNTNPATLKQYIEQQITANPNCPIAIVVASPSNAFSKNAFDKISQISNNYDSIHSVKSLPLQGKHLERSEAHAMSDYFTAEKVMGEICDEIISNKINKSTALNKIDERIKILENENKKAGDHNGSDKNSKGIMASLFHGDAVRRNQELVGIKELKDKIDHAKPNESIISIVDNTQAKNSSIKKYCNEMVSSLKTEESVKNIRAQNKTERANSAFDKGFQLERGIQAELANPNRDDNKIKSAYEQAFNHYKEAAKLGHTKAKTNLADFYSTKRDGIPYNPQCSFQLLLEAAKEGHSRAQYNLACSYTSSKCVVGKDLKQALFWFDKAAETKYEGAAVGAAAVRKQIAKDDAEKAAIDKMGNQRFRPIEDKQKEVNLDIPLKKSVLPPQLKQDAAEPKREGPRNRK